MESIKYFPFKQKSLPGFGHVGSLVTPELIAICKPMKSIIIYGWTKSGKVVIGRELSKQLGGRKLIISDDYQKMGWSENMYHIKRLIGKLKEPFIMEGVQAGRLLRKGVQFNDFYADLVIHLTINDKSMKVAYAKDGEGQKFNRAMAFNKNVLDNIFFQWYELQLKQAPKKMPKIIHLDTSFVK